MFSSKETDDFGIRGELEFEKGLIRTPLNLTTQTDIGYMRQTPQGRASLDDVSDLGVCVHWLKLRDIVPLINNKPNTIKKDITDKYNSMPHKQKIIHFDFSTDINPIGLGKCVIKLMEIQANLKPLSIEIPNYYGNKQYPAILKKGIEWSKNEKVDLPLMGVGCKKADLVEIENNLNDIQSIGINFYKEDRFLALRAWADRFTEEQLKEKKEKTVWIHGFGCLKENRIFNDNGTLNVFINSSGIDTYNIPVMARKFPPEGYIPRDPRDVMLTKRLFTPNNYDTLQYSNLLTNFDNDFPLNEFCECPVCKKNTLGSITENPSTENNKRRAHVVISSRKESLIYRDRKSVV